LPVQTLKENSTVDPAAATPWRELYRAALFETDKNRLSEGIAYAEWALVLRARELFHMGGEQLQERQAVDAALYALHVLGRAMLYDKKSHEPNRRLNGQVHAA
jgi:hypothetical protein